ncbi:methylamine utilization protein MauJ [Oceanospirillum beijerinckii]|uniref:methylamine utilization protein MauJ n=1 Tax=Oceanospirillum beijerinckii TaxID=64976 RepID=UPI0003FB5494|nr:methylamine utilization protein MauJ [Oceanospirillum beijerinckii]
MNGKQEKLSLNDLCRELGLDQYIVVGLANAGLLGRINSDQTFSIEAIENFKKYGTQWDSIFPERRLPYDDFPAQGGWESNLVGTMVQIEVAVNDQFDTSDEVYLAQFYLKPNPNFPYDPDDFFSESGSSIILDKKAMVRIDDFPDLHVQLCPGPNGRLLLFSVLGTAQNHQSMMIRANDATNAVISNLTFASDSPIHVCQKFCIGLPSGKIFIEAHRRSKPVDIGSMSRQENLRLIQPKSIYSAGVSSNEASYQFLSFFRVAENLNDDIGKIKRLRKEVIRFPDQLMYGEYRDKKLSKAYQDFESLYRHRIAHGGETSKQKKSLSNADTDEYRKMTYAIPIIRYVARSYILYYEKFGHLLSGE